MAYNSITNVFTVDLKQMQPIYSFCKANHGDFAAFDPYGDIYSCLVSIGEKNLAVGTYYPVVELKENSLYTRNIDSIPECSECIYSLLCGGGCAMLAKSCNDLNRPACASIHHQVHDLIPKLYQIRKGADVK